ncbi:MAG: DDE-type integrase/transposase/recombinase [Nanobdellota archaeon]
MKKKKPTKLTPKLRKWIIKQWQLGITPITDISRSRGVPRRTIYELIKRFKKHGIDGLEPKKRGRKKEPINSAFEDIVLRHWAELPRGSHKMWLDLKKQGFGVSQRKIQEIYNKYKIKMNKRKRPTQIKFVKYEWPKPNMLWHTDWTDCPFTGKKLIAFIDDNSRYIVHAEYFENATTQNTILAFMNAMDKYGIPENILTDQGSVFHENGAFRDFCEKNGIKHILGRVGHPQTNGKIERWFGTYKMEFQPQRWTLDQFVGIYNNVRLHQGIGYKTPKEKYRCAINSV